LSVGQDLTVVQLLVVIVPGVPWKFAANVLKINSLINVVAEASIVSVVELGISVVVIGGGTDLSLPFNAASSAAIAAVSTRPIRDAVTRSLFMVAAAVCIGASTRFRSVSADSNSLKSNVDLVS